MILEPNYEQILSKVSDYLRQLGVVIKNEGTSMKIQTTLLGDEKFEVLLSEFVSVLVALEEYKSRLNELQTDFDKFGNYINDQLGILIGSSDFTDLERILNQLCLILVNFIEIRSCFVLTLTENEFKCVFKFGLLNDFETSSLDTLKRYLLNKIKLKVNCYEVKDKTSLGGVCELGGKFLYLFPQDGINFKTLVGFFVDQNCTEYFERILNITSDLINLILKLHNYEKELVAYTSHLENLVNERTLKIQEEKRKAEEANASKSRFISNMSHELRTPLTAIVGYSMILRDGLLGTFNEEQRSALDSIVTAAEHLKSLIDDVLNLARIESGKDVPKSEQVEIEYLNSVIEIVKPLADKKNIGISFEIDTEASSCKFLVDRRHLRQIMLNLLSNAVKYTPDGGSVRVKVSKLADKLKIDVIDTGIGISEEHLERLFDRFERGDDEYSLAQEGTGIGLSITKSLVELNGGSISVKSQLNQGSTFTVFLPRTNIESRDLVQDSSTSFEDLTNISVLLVEDDVISSTLIEKVLVKLGAAVTKAASFEDAIKNINSKIDIVITDIGLKGQKSGLELLKLVKDSGINVPVIVLSANNDPALSETVFKLGADDFILKPFNSKELVSRVKNLVSNYLLLK